MIGTIWMMELDPGSGQQMIVTGVGRDIFFCKIDSNGSFVKEGSFGSFVDNENPTKVLMDSSGNYFGWTIPGGTCQTIWVSANGSHAEEITVGTCVDEFI